MLMKRLLVLMIAVLLPVSSWAAKPEWAGNKGGKQAEKSEQRAEKKHKEKQEEESIVSDTEEILDDIFSSEETETIRDYYNEKAASGTGKHKGKKKELPQGLRKKLERGGELPPGWQKKVARGEVLDSDLRSQAESIPDDLLSRLPGGDQATEIIKLKDKIIRVGKGEGTVVDIIDLADILTGRGGS